MVKPSYRGAGHFLRSPRVKLPNHLMGCHRLAGREEEETQVYSVVGFDATDQQLHQQVHTDLRQYLGFPPTAPVMPTLLATASYRLPPWGLRPKRTNT
jgi:hypothetical protein